MAEGNMRVCTVGHSVPDPKIAGRFKKFVLGGFYPDGEIEKKYSKPVTASIRKAKLIEVMERVIEKGRGLGADKKPDVDVVARLAKVKVDKKERDALLKEINGEEEGGSDK